MALASLPNATHFPTISLILEIATPTSNNERNPICRKGSRGQGRRVLRQLANPLLEVRVPVA